MLEVFRRLGSIQFDPLAVAGRTHDLVLHARVADYDPAWCDLLYERREIFEAYNKGLSLVPTRDFPWFRGTLSRNAPRLLAENAEVAGRVLDRIRADGPLSSLDFERAQGETTDWFGVPTNTVRAVLEAYAVTGVLGLARRDGNRRYYDLLERLLPADVLAHSVPLDGAAPAQAPLALPRTRPPRRRGSRHLRRPRSRQAGSEVAGGSGQNGTARGARRRRRARSCRDRGCAREALRPRGRGRAAGGCPGAAALGRLPAAVRPVGVGPASARIPVRVRLRLGALRPAGQAPLGLVRAADALPRPPRRPDRAAHRPRRRPGAGARPLVGGRLRADAAPRASSTRCGMRFAPTCASQAQRASSGRRTSQRRSDCFSRDPRTTRVRGRPGRTGRRASRARAPPVARAAGAALRRSSRASRRAAATSR